MTGVDESYEAKALRSVNLMDVEEICAFAKALSSIGPRPGSFVDGAGMQIASDGGYLIGDIWWEPEGERWVVDFGRYGEPR